MFGLVGGGDKSTAAKEVTPIARANNGGRARPRAGSVTADLIGRENEKGELLFHFCATAIGKRWERFAPNAIETGAPDVHIEKRLLDCTGIEGNVLPSNS